MKFGTAVFCHILETIKNSNKTEHVNRLKFGHFYKRTMLNAEYIKENLECRLFENLNTNS